MDRLSRFKLPENSFQRVFESVILKHLIEPKYSKKDIQSEDIKKIASIFKIIWNDSVEACCSASSEQSNKYVQNALKFLVKSTFKNTDEKTSILIDTDINIAPILKMIDYDNAPKNIKFLIQADKFTYKLSYNELREFFGLCFPIKKLLIVEGITEEILLPVFAKKMGKDFDRHGIYILGAGGKSKSPSLYLKLRERLKIPIILLFDADAKEICENLSRYMLEKDKCIRISKGEFEDIIPLTLIKRTLNNEYNPATPVCIDDLRHFEKMCDNLEFFYRNRNLGEYKKSRLSQIIAKNIKYKTDISSDINGIISDII